MIVMLDTPQPLADCAAELGAPVEQFFSPQTYRLPQFPDQPFAIDNGAFGNFDGALFLRLVARELYRRHLCRFLAVPDVPYCAERTLAVFEVWAAKKELQGWPLAYVGQDNQRRAPIPWDRFKAFFLGGSTEWKISDEAAKLVQEAKERGKWVHAGRVNTPGRFTFFKNLRADSIDGTGLARYTHMRTRIYDEPRQPTLAL